MCKAIPSHKIGTRCVRGPVMHGTADQRAIARRHAQFLDLRVRCEYLVELNETG